MPTNRHAALARRLTRAYDGTQQGTATAADRALLDSARDAIRDAQPLGWVPPLPPMGGGPLPGGYRPRWADGTRMKPAVRVPNAIVETNAPLNDRPVQPGWYAVVGFDAAGEALSFEGRTQTLRAARAMADRWLDGPSVVVGIERGPDRIAVEMWVAEDA